MSSMPSPFEPTATSGRRSRSGVLAAWTTAWLAGSVAFDDVVDAVVGTDEQHTVSGLSGPDGSGVPLGWALSELRARGVRCVRVVLPAPGDPRGLPGGTDFAAAAMAAGEAVLADGGPGLVPQISVHGSAVGSRTILVDWQVFEVPPATPDPLPTPQAEQELAEAIRDTAAAMAQLDVASWRPEVADALGAVRSGRAGTDPLPPGHDSRAVRLLAQADRLGIVLEVAEEDSPGGSVNAQEALTRAELLRPLAVAVRRARVAAYNAACAD